ncbi:LuxS/MPP-like metallohydrolase [Daedaleopsis nitida]|nr:LuxS/MPP-like metallohydrolase [Daedaleopsis nitida]
MSTSSGSWAEIPASGELPPYRLFTGHLEKPELDDRHYRVLELQNGVKAVLIHDPEADKAAACLAVALGYMYDPIDAPGMAHFCEHMISKGSEPFPEENDFYSFIATNGGTRNAATGPMTTDYWFTINPAQLRAGLPRLAAFFSAPLFTESLTAREINAVDSEYKRNLQNDVRRVLQLTKDLSLPGHPWSKFGTGNYATLSAFGRKGEGDSEEEVMKETRRRLVEWWKEHYCASRMSLAVIGKESLEELTSLVVPAFSKIENSGLEPRPTIKDPVWGVEQHGVCDQYAFSVQFELPDLRERYLTLSTSLLGHLLGHEGKGSICAYLKKRGWLLGLSAGVSGNTRAVHLFKVEGTLTLEGYLHYESVLETVFAHIALLRRAQPLPSYHYSELATMARTSFRFREKGPPRVYAGALAQEFFEPYPPEWLLSGPSLYGEHDEELTKSLLNGFVPEKARVLLMAKTHREEVVGADVRWETAKWYGTQYFVRRMDDGGLLQRLQAPSENSELALPAPNPYIPADLSVDKAPVPEPAKYPILVKRTESAQLWHKKDDQFWVPRAKVRIFLKSPIAYVTVRHAMMTRLFVDLVQDALSEVTYDAAIAGLGYSVGNDDEGISIGVGGYNDKLDVLLRTVLEKICGIQVAPDRLQVFQEKIQRGYENFYLGQPSNLSETFAKWLLMPTVWTPADRLTELSRIGVLDIERHRDELLSKTCIDILVTGNYTRERSLDILTMTEQCLQSRSLLPNERPTPRSLLFPPGSNFVLRKLHANPKELNSSLSYYCQFGEPSDVRLRAITSLMLHILREPCFSTLRTKEQLGYVVAATTWVINSGTLGLGIKVQSTRAPRFVEGRVEAFLEAFAAQLAALSDEQFAKHKEGLIVKKLERVKNLGEETARYWDRIRAGHYDFLRHEKSAEAVSELTLAEVVEAYNTLMRPSTGAKTRRKFSVHLVSQQLDETAAEERGEVQFIDDESLFKCQLACAPAVTPVMSEAFGEFFHDHVG